MLRGAAVKSAASTFRLAVVILISISFTACHSTKKEFDAPTRVYRIALINAGAYTALYNQAAADLGAYREINLLTDSVLNKELSPYGIGQESLAKVNNFSQVAAIKNIDFAIILMPAPPAYTAGFVGIKSINWVTRTVHIESAVTEPKKSYDWLLLAQNGWTTINSNPPGAYIEIDGKYSGSAPVVVMAEKKELTVTAYWTDKIKLTETVNVAGSNQIVIRAPDDYVAKMNKKGTYQRMQDADTKYGEKVFMGFYVILLIGSVALLFYSPLAEIQ